MQITRVEIRKLRLPMIRSFVTSYGVVDAKDTLITKLYTADGLVGYGESPALSAPFFNSETTDTCLYMVRQFIAPALVGKHLTNIGEFVAALPPLQDVYTAKTGPECAFWHLLAQRDNVSLKELFGGTREEIAVGESIDIKPLEETLQEIAQRLSEGYRRIKVKIEPGWDFEPLAAIREQWPDITLTADANASYRLRLHERELRALDQFELAMVEQPLAAHDLVDHARLQKLIRTPVCLDESIQQLEDMRTAHALGACKIVNLKPMRVGGIYECMKIHDFAAEHDMSVWCGGMFETGIGRAFNIALASKKHFDHPADMSPYNLFYAEDLLESSFTVKQNGCIDVPNTPGLGYRISDRQIDKFTLEKAIVPA